MSDLRPSKKQRELLSFIDGFIKGHGYGPSYREIMRALNYKSVSTVAVHIDELIAKGHLRKREHSARSLEVMASDETFRANTPPTKTEEKWLINKIDAHFAKAEKAKTQKLIDDLYVLVGSLHVLGFDDAHRAFRVRLLALQKNISS